MVNTQGIRNKKPPKAIRQWIARMVRILFFKISIPMLSVWNRIVLWFWGAKVWEPPCLQGEHKGL